MQVFQTSPAAIYTGIGHAVTRISNTEGIRVLWRGVSSVIAGAGPAHAVHFGVYEAVKEFAGGNQAGWAATGNSTRNFLRIALKGHSGCWCKRNDCE
jgi:solute carrier family 25 iron transporter 28/37